MTARVRGAIAAAMRAGSIVSVSGSTSTSTGRAPTCSMTLTVAAHVSGVVLTSSPGPISLTARAVCRAAVNVLRGTDAGAGTMAANAASHWQILASVLYTSWRRDT